MATVASIKPTEQTAAVDDGVREVHGLKLGSDYSNLVAESGSHVVLVGVINVHLTPRQARYIARKLYRLARRVEQRELLA